MKEPVVLIGVGEMGGVFARGLLRAGWPVVPVTRDMEMAAVAAEVPEPAMVLLAVAEKDLHPALEALPEAWRSWLALLQNELLPRDWERHGLAGPTVISVWFEKKRGMDAKVIIPSPCFGPQAGLLVDGLAALDIPARQVTDEGALLFELVLKNLYILTSNIAGLKVGGNVAELWADHQPLARAVAADVVDLQEVLTGQVFDREALIQGMVTAFEGDPAHGCMGRSAPARLERAIALAEENGLAVPTLREIAAAR
ncbi:ketopantoate reductase family protein [Endothiovibrio diazotrophicus]